MRARFAARFGGELAARLEFRTINGVAARIIALYSRMYGRTRRSSSAMRARPRRCSCGYGRTQTTSTRREHGQDLRTAITYIKKYVSDRRGIGRAGNRH